MKQRINGIVHLQGAKARFIIGDAKPEKTVWKTGDVVYLEANNAKRRR